MPRWVLILAAIIGVVWMLTDPAGLATFIKHGMDAVITFIQKMTA